MLCHAWFVWLGIQVVVLVFAIVGCVGLQYALGLVHVSSVHQFGEIHFHVQVVQFSLGVFAFQLIHRLVVGASWVGVLFVVSHSQLIIVTGGVLQSVQVYQSLHWYVQSQLGACVHGVF